MEPRSPKFRPLVALLLLALVCAGGPPQRASDEAPLRVVVLHTNDVHGQLLPLASDGGPRGGLLRLAEAVRAERARAEAEGALVLVLDAGDWSQGTPEGRVRGGAPFLGALAAIGYDAMCIGNHELDAGRAALEALLERVRPPAVLANVRDPGTGERVGWAPPWRVVERGGLRVAVVGLLAETTPSMTHADAGALVFEDPLEALDRTLAELQDERVDLVVPLTHLGLLEDERLARAHPELPLVVGGHSHTFLPHGRNVGPTRVVQAGQKAQVLGKAELWLERSSGKVVRSRAELVELPAGDEALADAARALPALAARCAELERETGESWERVVGRLAAPLERTREARSSSAGNLLADVLRAHAGADVALHNKGGLRRELAAGPVTARDLFELLPFDNTVSVLALSGAELERLLHHAVDERRALGIEVSGATLALARDRGRLRLERILVGGAALEPERAYRLATNSFVAGGGDDLVPAELRARAADTGVLLRDALEQAFAAAGELVPTDENRMPLAGER